MNDSLLNHQAQPLRLRALPLPTVLTLSDGLVEASPLEAAARRQTREQQAMRTADL